MRLITQCLLLFDRALNPSTLVRLRCAAAAFLLLLLAHPSVADIAITVGHNFGDAESPSFTFSNVPPPSRNDAGTTAKFVLVSGAADGNSGGLATLHDGKLPTEADEPGANFFFAAGTPGGRVEVDLGRICEVKEINTYSWHPSTRGPQVYQLYAGLENDPAFNPTPGTGPDLARSGWKLLVQVDTRANGAADGGQYGVSLHDTRGSLGKYRYLLFDLAPTETADPFGNTFYSEIDVVEAGVPPAPAAAAANLPWVVQTADGQAEIRIDTSRAPDLEVWAREKLAPALAAWYPKIVAMMPSEGFVAPRKFTVTIRPGDGVAFTTGTHIAVNSTWLAGELNREAVGAIIHESVHVVQQYGGGWRQAHSAPGWLTEGIPDYIRFFKYEPQTHGADLVWLKAHPRLNLNYDGLYRISANFLDYVVRHYDPDQTLIQKVNAACRQGKYTDDLWPQLTGKSLAELNEEWKAAGKP